MQPKIKKKENSSVADGVQKNDEMNSWIIDLILFGVLNFFVYKTI